MKIGILTFHRAHNYGAVLQAFALQKQIKLLGHDVEVIDYRPKEINQAHDLFHTKIFLERSWGGKILHVLDFFFLSRSKIKRYINFKKFINSLGLSKVTYRGEENSFPEYDCIFFGSDQIWNPSIFNGFDYTYTGQLKKSKTKFISYAASAGMLSLLKSQKDEFIKVLENFDSISVREKNLQEYIRDLTKNEVETVLDPVLLLDKKEWDNTLIVPHNKKPYVLVYQVKRDNKVNVLAEKIAKENNWDLVELTCEVFSKKKTYANQTVSPLEFVGYFKFAKFIVTTSFHGTAFAIIFNTPFYSVMFNSPNDERSKSLLELTKLEDRAITLNEKKIFSEVDFTKANILLDEKKNKSIDFIRESI